MPDRYSPHPLIESLSPVTCLSSHRKLDKQPPIRVAFIAITLQCLKSAVQSING